MKKVLKSLCCLGLLAGLSSFASAATMTKMGQISDSNCGASHAKMTSGHAGMTDRACTLACVKAGGKYVFVSDGKVYNISNQDSPLLAMHAGHSVNLTGDIEGDTVKVSKITMEKK